MTAFALADVFLTPSRRSLVDYVEHFHIRPARAVVVPNGVPLPSLDFSQLLERRAASWPTPRLVWVGRVSLEKRIDFLLRSFRLFLARHPNATLTLVGDGGYRDHFSRYTETLGIQDCVLWVGYRSDPLPYLLDAHVFLHACLSEEFGYTLAEAMAAGLPVVAYDCPYGPREILDGGRYGMLVSTEEEMADALSELFRDKALWRSFAERSLERAKDFDLRKISEAYRRLFARILDDGGW